MYDRILIPTDGSKASSGALEHAITHALEYDATLYALNVVDASIFAADIETGALIETHKAAGERAVSAVADRAAEAGLESVVTEVIIGRPHREILAYSEEQNIDLIVMGTHGRTGLGRYLLGSVTEKVVRLSEVPVLTVRTATEQSAKK